MRLLISILFFVLCCAPVCTQTVEPSCGVDKRTFQIELESMYLLEKQEAEEVVSWSIPSVLVRYGLSNSLELQFNAPLQSEAVYANEGMLSSRTFLDKVQAGFALNVLKENGVWPETAIMVRALVPVYSYDTSDVGTLVALNMSNRLSDVLSLNYNLGWISEEGQDSGYYIANVSWEISATVHAFLEFFGSTYSFGDISHNINTGMGFNLGNSFCLDFSVGKGLNQEMFLVGGILSYQLSI